MADTYKYHWELTGNELHDNKLHASTHYTGGTDPLDLSQISFSYSSMTSTNIVDAIIEAYNNGASNIAWGNITGTLALQTDLQAVLDSKQSTLTIGVGLDLQSGYLLSLDANIDDLNDVNTSGVAKNYVLKWNGSAWVPAVYNASFTFAIATFVCDAGATGTIFEIGASGTWKAMGSLSFTATYNNGPATNGYITHTGWSNLTMGGTGYVGPTTNAEVVTYPSVGSTKTFTLNATDGTDNSTNTITYYFYNRRYWGVSSTASSYIESDIEGLANNDLSNSRAKTFTVTASTGEYIIYSYPSRLGTATFTVGGFEGGFQPPETVSVTNASGYTENYYVYRSTNTNLGATTVVVS